MVSSDLPTGVTYVSRHGRTGLTTPVGDARALAAAIQALLDDPTRAAAMGAYARERVQREFSLERMVTRTLAVYREVLSSGNVARSG